LIAGLLAIPLYVSAQTSAGVELRKIDTEISDKQQEIAAINKKIAELDKKRGTTAAEADAIAVALERLKASLRKAELELDKTTSAVKRVQIDQRETKQESDALQEEISQKRTQLTSLLRQLYSLEQESLVRIFFDSKSLSDVLASRDAYESLQENAVRVISEMHQQQDKLQEQQQQLEQQEQDLGELQQLLDAQAKDLALQRTEQRKFLQEKQESRRSMSSSSQKPKQREKKLNSKSLR